MIGFDPLEPFGYAFFQRGMAAAVVAGALCGLVGVYVVLRQMSYAGHGLSHAVFGGAAGAEALGLSYFVGAGVWGVVVAILIARVARSRSVGGDAAIGVVTTASLAIGLIIRARSGGAMRSIEAVLFGDVVGVAGVDLVWLVVLAVALVGGLVWWRREIAFVTVDAEVAAVHGVAAARFETALMVAVAATVIVSARVIGALLVAAMLVLPGATARLTAPSLTSVVRRAPLLGAACGATGMYVSWYADVPAGAAITLMSTMVFLVEFGRSDAARRRTVADADRHAEFV